MHSVTRRPLWLRPLRAALALSLVLPLGLAGCGADDATTPGGSFSVPDTGGGTADTGPGGTPDATASEDAGPGADTGASGDTGTTPGPDASGCTPGCDQDGATRCDPGGVATCGDPDGDGCHDWSATVPCESGQVCIDGACAESCPGQACSTAGARKCSQDGTGVLTCGDSDGDGCLDWGAPTACDGDLVCAQGFCQVSCADECTTAGARKCDGGDVVTCQDHDADGCLEWGGAQACGPLVCSGGFCVSECTDECTVVGAKKCDGNGVTACGDANGDGCLEWGTVLACDPGTTCSGGFCATTCKDECDTVGAKKCELNGVEACGNFDADGCLEWGSPTPCEAGLVCSNGACATECKDGCAAAGTKQCQGGGVATCADHNGDGCLDWGTVSYCAGDQVCSGGFCTSTCADDCTVKGAKKCKGDGVLTCGDSNGDGCLDWGTPDPCAAGLVCTGGHCAAECFDECTVSGAKKCDGNALVVCGDDDTDGCLEWGAPSSCAAGLLCNAGACETQCTDECTVSGAKKCDGGGVAVCGNYDADSCLEWGAPTPCSAGLVCSAGNCQTKCSDECTVVGAKHCEPGGLAVCGDSNDDGCLEWGTPVPCGAPLVCALGNCTTTCTNECEVSGAKQCAAGGAAQVQACGDTNGDGCLEWGSPVACDAGLACAAGSCVSQCTDACDTVGAKTCSGGGVVTCGDSNGDGCLEWGTVAYCPTGQTCSAGFCTSTCVNACTSVGAQKCVGDGVAVCGDGNGDGCLEWGTPTACATGQSCSAGHCAAQCSDECTVVGAKQCDPAGIVTCGNHDADACLEWGTPAPCDAPYVCALGNCALGCTDECDVVGQKQCVVGATGQLQECGDFNADGCLEWGSAQDCAAGLVCSNGNCKATCESTCAVDGQTVCDGNGTKTCGDTNGDGCLEWGTIAWCDPWQTCTTGTCVSTPPPAKVVISELFYDAVGGDADAFVELAGPAGADLGGFSLVGVNGNDGKDYNAIALGGAIPASGLYVVANAAATAWVADQAQLLSGNADYQNGPDSVQLLYGDTVVDAVGYGSFATATFAGEGNPAVDVPAGKSLARTPGAADTDDNATDFAELDPTPGAPNAAANKAPKAVLACPGSGAVGEALVFDGSGSSDSDGAITTYGFAFGDGSPAASGASKTATHAYTGAGTWTVTLTVTDDAGAKATATCAVVITSGQTGDQAPTASFVATVGIGLGVTVDATASTDPETPPAALLVRWDFDNDGVWDTDWATDRIAEHIFPSAGTYTIRLGVKDSAGQTDTDLQAITLATATYVAGQVGTTTWSGIIIVTNDVTVAAGETLTIAAGTQVLVMFIDGGNGEGAVGIKALGKVVVQGTAAKPVLFTVFQAANKKPRGWDGLSLWGNDSTISHATIEYANRGVQVWEAAAAAINDSVIRFCRIGFTHEWFGTTNLQGVTVTGNQELGAWIYGSYNGNSNVSAVGCTFSDNGQDGIFVDNAGALTLADSEVFGNGTNGVRGVTATVGVFGSRIHHNAESGLYLYGETTATKTTVQSSTIEANQVGITYMGSNTGPVTASEIRDNAWEGVRLFTLFKAKQHHPSPSITGSNIHGNSTERGARLGSPGISFSTQGLGSAWQNSPPWETPGGHPLLWARFSYDQTQAGYGALETFGPPAKYMLQVTADYPERWVDISEFESSTVMVGALSYASFGWAVMTVPTVIWTEPGAATELLSVTETAAPTVSCTGNWWGVAAGGAPDVVVSGVDGKVDAAGAKSAAIAGVGAP